MTNEPRAACRLRLAAPTRLWGGRFADGPSDAMAALSLSTHFDWRLAPYDVMQTRRPRPGPARCGPAHRRRAVRRRRRARRARGRDHGRHLRPDPGRRGRPHRRRARPHRAARRPRRQAPRRAQPQRPGVHRLPAVPARPRAADRRGRHATSRRLCSRRREAHVDTYSPGFTHLQHAQPVSFGHELAKHVHALGRDVERLADWDRRAARSPLGAGALAGSSLGLDPQAVAARPRLRRGPRQLDRRDQRPRLGGGVPVRRRHDRRPPVADGRGGHPDVLARVRLGHARRRVVDGLVDHAAEEESRRRRARPRQVRPAHRQPHRAARHPEGPALRLQPRPAGGQGAGVRHGRAAAAGPAGDDRDDRDAALRHRAHGAHPPRGLRTRHRHRRVARPRAACRSARRTRSPARACAARGGARRRAVGPHRRRPRRDLAAPDARRPRRAHACAGSLDSRSAFGGTAPARVAEQLEALSAVLDEQRVAWSCGARARARGPACSPLGAWPVVAVAWASLLPPGGPAVGTSAVSDKVAHALGYALLGALAVASGLRWLPAVASRRRDRARSSRWRSASRATALRVGRPGRGCGGSLAGALLVTLVVGRASRRTVSPAS